MSEELDEVCGALGVSYQVWKATEADKNRLKGEFFTLADETIEKRHGLAVKLVEYPAPHLEEARERATRHNPGWKVDEVRPRGLTLGVYEVVLKEDPSFKPFSHEHGGVKYARTVSRGAVMLDDEWLAEEDPGLYSRVTYPLPWGERVAVPVEHLSAEVVGQLAKYLYNATPRVSLAAPKEIKESE